MKRIIIISILIISNSCGKEDNDIFFGNYYSQRMEISEIKLFTKNDKVNDVNIMKNFIESYNLNYFIFNYDSIIEVTNKLRIEFITNNKAKFYLNDNVELRDVTIKKNIIYFEAKDTSSVLKDSSFYDKVITYHPLYSEDFIVHISSSYKVMTLYKHCFFATSNNNELKLPLISFLYVKKYSSDYYSYEGRSNLNNAFNTNSLSYLTEIDTLVVQELNLILSK